jgi:hypothetical protein
MQFTDPCLITARTQVLDYFTQQRLTIRDDHILFRWERDMDTDLALVQLMEQVCLEIGFPHVFQNREQLSMYVTGELPALIEFYPELEVFRDIVFLFKFMQTPTVEALPEIKYWLPTDARLAWKYNVEKRRYSVSGFGNKLLKPYAMMPEGAKRGKQELVSELEEEEKGNEEDSKELKEAREALEQQKLKEKESKPGFLSSLFSRFFGKKSRAPPSAADPSALCGQEIENEDDVLHLRRMPDFGGRITQRNSELLVSSVTVQGEFHLRM